jgi:hypothetical protein
MRASESPATQEELIVNEKIFGECNHDDWNEFQDKFHRTVLVCTQCGNEVEYSCGQFGMDTPALSPAEFLKSTIRKYSKEDVLASFIIRTVEASGWTPLLKNEGHALVCELTRLGKSFSSGRQETRAAAVCHAAAKLGASGLFRVTRSA